MDLNSISNVDLLLVNSIVKRARKMLRDVPGGVGVSTITLCMDIVACHLNGNPLKLSEWLAADNFNFIHDVVGIYRHIDRSTGKLSNCFLPRFSL